MGRYRKIDTRIHNDAKFRNLSDDAKLVFFVLMTHPGMTALGAMRHTAAGLAAEMDWKPKRLDSALAGELEAADMVEIDAGAAYIGLPNFLKYNGPESPNVVRAWGRALELIPECTLRLEQIARAREIVEGMSEGYLKAFEEVLGEG